jgi:antitoxin (DNA-binding transcriptional repressor) of toxin-antitoxin stability system
MLQKIGIREFRNNLAKYLSASEPIAVMRHGQTIGYFLPTHQKPAIAELETLKVAAAKLDALLAAKGVTEDELVEEFRQLREKYR